MMNTIQERITNILLDTFKIHRGAIGTDTTFADLGFDSLAIVELSLVLDSEFGTALEDGELDDTMTTTDAAELILVKGAAPRRHPHSTTPPPPDPDRGSRPTRELAAGTRWQGQG